MKLLNAFRLTMTLLGALMLIGACRVVQAQEPRRATITFTAPTQRTDGSAITGALSYEVYQGLKGQDKVLVGTITATVTTIDSGLLGGHEYCWHVVAIEAGNPAHSAPSNEACKVFALAQPETVTITVQ